MIATVVVLTFNAGVRINQVLTAVLKQKTDVPWELLVIDSGSRDTTLEAIRRHRAAHRDQIRLHEIPNAEFGHGRTRNLAAQMAAGDFVLFLTHDAVPAHDGWLQAMIEPFALSPRVACAFGKHIPWPHASATIKRD